MSSKALRTLLAAWICWSWAGCSDDDGPKSPSDASVDAATDAGNVFIPRRDASVVAGDPIRECNRYAPNACPPGQTCDLLVRQFGANPELTIYTGCVTATRERGLGDPCDPEFWVATQRYETEGLTDLVFRDQCGPGLVCGDDPKVKGASSCQPSCVSGLLPEGGEPYACSDPNSFCVPRSELQEFCRESDGCDVARQTGCRPGFACYLRTRDDRDGFISVCYPPYATRVADGQPCSRYNECRPGSSCTGPLSIAMRRWVAEDIQCRPTCNEDGSLVGSPAPDADAGEDDGGTGGGSAMCTTPRECVPYSGTGLSLSGIPEHPYGQCE